MSSSSCALELLKLWFLKCCACFFLFFYDLFEILLCKVQPNRLKVLKAVTICAFETVFHSKLHFPPLLSSGPSCTFKSTMWMSSRQCSGSPSTEPRWPRARFTIASCRWRPQTRTAPHSTARSVTTRSPPPAHPSLSIATVSRREEKDMCVASTGIQGLVSTALATKKCHQQCVTFSVFQVLLSAPSTRHLCSTSASLVSVIFHLSVNIFQIKFEVFCSASYLEEM